MDVLPVIQGFLLATGEGWIGKDQCAVPVECRKVTCEGKKRKGISNETNDEGVVKKHLER